MFKLNRDSIGRFIPRRTKIASLIYMGLAIIVCAYMLSELAVRLNNWSKENGLQKPIVILTNQGDEILKVVKRPIVYKREPLQVLSPFVTELTTQVDILDMTPIEKKILNAFGIRDFKVMRAIAKCESGMNPLAVNWGSKDIGLFQINLPTWERAIKDKFGYTIVDLFDEDKNIEVAKWIWDRDGDGEGNINPWVATTTSCFRGEL